MVVLSVRNLAKELLKYPPHSMARSVMETIQSLDIVSLTNVEDLLVFPVWLDHPGFLVLMAPQDPKVSLDKMVLPVNVDLKDPLDHKDLPEMLDQRETPVFKVFPDPRVLSDNLDLVVRLESKETPDLLDLPENLDPQEVQVLLDLPDPAVPLETTVFPVTKVFLDLLGLPVYKVYLAKLVLVVFPDPRVSLDLVGKLLNNFSCLLMFKQVSNLLIQTSSLNVNLFGILMILTMKN